MTKWIGNRFGDNVPVVADSVSAAPAVYNMNDQYFLQSLFLASHVQGS